MEAAGNHESSRPFDEKPLYGFLNGSALLAFGISSIFTSPLIFYRHYC